MILRAHTILFVNDQKQATAFYQAVLGIDPSLNVNGMTEFTLSDTHILGLMPVKGAERLLNIDVPPNRLSGELYLMVNDPAIYHDRALAHGAIELSPLQHRDWGDRAAYSTTPDGHLLAFAERG